MCIRFDGPCDGPGGELVEGSSSSLMSQPSNVGELLTLVGLFRSKIFVVTIINVKIRKFIY